MKHVMMTGTLVALCAWAAVCSGQPTANQDEILLTVNGESVRASEVRMVMQNVAAQLQQSGQQIDQERLFQAATQQVIDTKLLAQEALRRGVTSEKQTVDNIMSRIESEAGGAEALQVYLETVSVSRQELRDSVQQSILAQQLIDTAIRPAVEVTDEDVDTFYNENPQMFQQPEQVNARHILIMAKEDATAEAKAEARQRAEKARQRALAGEDFATLAEELSEGPSAPNGGDLGFFSADRMVKPFADAAFALQPGEISEVVETQFGYHVIKVEERRPPSTQSLDEVRESLKNALVERRVGEGIQSLATELRSKAEIVPVAVETSQPDPSSDSG